MNRHKLSPSEIDRIVKLVKAAIELDNSAFNWRTATCGGCGYWEVVLPAKKGSVVGTHEMGRCRKGYLLETHPATIINACPDYVPREVPG